MTVSRETLARRAAYMRQWRKSHPLTPEQRKKRNYSGATLQKRRAATLAWIRANAERVKKYHVAYHIANREKHNLKRRLLYAKNREQAKAYAKAWKAAHPLYVRNHDKARVYSRAWAKAHPGEKNASTSLRLARNKRAAPIWVDRNALASIYVMAKTLGKVVDHVIPLQHPLVCGLHVPWNLQFLSATENNRKHNKFDQDSSVVP